MALPIALQLAAGPSRKIGSLFKAIDFYGYRRDRAFIIKIESEPKLEADSQSDKTKETLSMAAGLGSLAGLSAAGATVVTAISSLSGLAASANVAAAALGRVGVAGGAGGAASAAAGAAGGAGASKLAGGLRGLSALLGWGAVATIAGPYLFDLTAGQAAGTDDTKGGGAANYRRRLGKSRAEFEDLVANAAGPFDRYQPSTWNARRGVTSSYLRQLGLADDEPGSRSGWQNSAIANIKQAPSGPGKWGDVSVSGTVTGTAELHQSLTIEVRPSAYLESVVKRAEHLSAINLNGKLGTGMQGPGDNSTKPSQGPLTAGH